MKSFRTAIALSLISLAGCSTLADTFSPAASEQYLGRKGPNILGGVRMDVSRVGDPSVHGIAVPFYILDTPFSLVLDVVMMPFTIPYVLLSGKQSKSPVDR